MFSLYHAELLAELRRKELEYEAQLHRMRSIRERKTVGERLCLLLVWAGTTMVAWGERLQSAGLRTTVPVASPMRKTACC